MLKATDVLITRFDENLLRKLNEQRLKSLKRACYQFVGNRYYCCEFRCEHRDLNETEQQEVKNFEYNINLISKVQKQFSVD